MLKRVLCLILIICLLGSVSVLAADTERMTTSEAGIALIKYYEGFSEHYIVDGSGYAIGYGCHVDLSLYPNGITLEEADELMRSIVSGMEDAIYTKLLDKYNVTLTQHQFDALIDLTYNLGSAWLNTDYRLFNMIASGIQYYSDQDIIDTFGRYSKAEGTVIPPLVWRRLADAKIFLYGDYKFGGTQNYEYELVDGYPSFYKENGLTYSKFTDVNCLHWSYPYIAPLTYIGVVEGYPDGKFQPDSAVTCGEALKLILVSTGYGTQAPTLSHWASGYLSLAEGLGMVDPGDIGDLDGPISRRVMAKLTAGAAEIAATSSASPFADTSDYSVLALYDAGIVTGSFEGEARLFKPEDSLTRGELCAIVWRLANYNRSEVG